MSNILLTMSITLVRFMLRYLPTPKLDILYERSLMTLSGCSFLLHTWTEGMFLRGRQERRGRGGASRKHENFVLDTKVWCFIMWWLGDSKNWIRVKCRQVRGCQFFCNQFSSRVQFWRLHLPNDIMTKSYYLLQLEILKWALYLKVSSFRNVFLVSSILLKNE